MNASIAFRSHLMQQFAASARTQTRPPLALLGWVKKNQEETTTNEESPARTTASQLGSASHHHSYGSSTIGGLPLLSSIPESSQTRSLAATTSPASRRLLSSASMIAEEGVREESDDEECDTQDLVSAENQEQQLSALFQTLLQTRRSSNRFEPMPRILSTASEQAVETAYWKDLIERAALCGYSAPNHKRTEPFTFKRMIAPSASTERLAEIAYHVSLLQQQQQQTLQASAVEDAATATTLPNQQQQQQQMQDRAERKREKWRRIPAFLVTLVESPDDLVAAAVDDDEDDTSSSSSSLDDEYQPLPFVPPRTERELEDYAASCAATQNVLLSLHSEHVASKWVTGPVIQTRAFRKLVQARPQDRVVSLVMIGRVKEQSKVYKRRHRREFYGDVLVDL